MRLVKQKHSVLTPKNPMQHIERCARVCYKSEDKMTDSTSADMIKRLYKNKHLAMLEHYRFIMVVNEVLYTMIERVDHPYIKMTHSNDRYMISFSATSLINMVKFSNARHHGILEMAVKCVQEELMYHIVKKYGCKELFGMSGQETMMLSTPVEFIDPIVDKLSDEEYRAHMWWTVLCTTDRGITHEIVRMRDCSFAQESTRYCNYGGDVAFIGQQEFMTSEQYSIWYNSMALLEMAYSDLLNNGLTPQFARSVLPTSVKADIVITATQDEWDHIFSLRCDTSAHPQMRSLMLPIYKELRYKLKYHQNCWYECDSNNIEI